MKENLIILNVMPGCGFSVDIQQEQDNAANLLTISDNSRAPHSKDDMLRWRGRKEWEGTD